MRSVSLGPWRWTHQLVATLGVVTAGGIGVGLGAWFDFRCPFASAGFACAGCGCSRAVTIAVQDGVIAAFERQPSALLLIVGLIVSIAVSGTAVARERRQLLVGLLMPRFMLTGVLLLATANFAYQLDANL